MMAEGAAESPLVEVFVNVNDRGLVVRPQSPGAVVTPTTIRPESFSNDLMDAVARSSAEFVAWVTGTGIVHDLDPALVVLATENDFDIVYSDESAVVDGKVVHIKRPEFDAERLRNQFYFGRPIFYRREFLISIGGIDATYAGAEDYELALRASRAARSIGHIGLPLFAGGASDGHLTLSEAARRSTAKALEVHLAATGGGRVLSIGDDGVCDTRRSVVGEPLVSIVIPSRGTFAGTASAPKSYLLDAVRSIVDVSTYPHLQFVIVLDDAADPQIIDQLHKTLDSRLVIVPWSKPFNFSEKINAGVVHASGEFVLILNDDVQVLTPEWIESLLALAQLPGAGMSGALLYYEDDTIQHAGHAYFEGDASHIGLDEPRNKPGPMSGYRVEREVVGVTAACAMMPISVYREVGGMSSLLPGNFNDVDLCMKVTWLGYHIYWTPHAELYHFESKTRDASVRSFEVEVAWGRWGFRMHDPRYWPYPHTRTPTPASSSAW